MNMPIITPVGLLSLDKSISKHTIASKNDYWTER